MAITKERGLLTAADLWRVSGLSIDITKSAHGGEFALANQCEHCKALVEALKDWCAAHVAGSGASVCGTGRLYQPVRARWVG